jgi:hypothetical protein
VGAQSLVITLTQNGYTLGFAFGGARAASVASGGDAVDDLLDGGTDVLGDVSDIAVPDGLGFDDLGGLGADGFNGLTSTGNGDGGAGPTLDVTPVAAAATGRPLSRAAVILGALAALLFGFGLRRLNTTVLADPPGGLACKLPGDE